MDSFLLCRLTPFPPFSVLICTMEKRPQLRIVLISIAILAACYLLFRREMGFELVGTELRDVRSGGASSRSKLSEDWERTKTPEALPDTDLRGGLPTGRNKPETSVPLKTSSVEVEKAVARFDASLKRLESKRAIFVPQDPKDNGNVVKVYISEPSIDEVSAIGHLMSSELSAVENELRGELRKALQKKYDQYINFKKPFRYVDAVRAENWTLIKVTVADAEFSDGKDLSFTADFFMDPKKPASENRYSHLFGIENVPK